MHPRHTLSPFLPRLPALSTPIGTPTMHISREFLFIGRVPERDGHPDQILQRAIPRALVVPSHIGQPAEIPVGLGAHRLQHPRLECPGPVERVLETDVPAVPAPRVTPAAVAQIRLDLGGGEVERQHGPFPGPFVFHEDDDDGFRRGDMEDARCPTARVDRDRLVAPATPTALDRRREARDTRPGPGCGRRCP